MSKLRRRLVRLAHAQPKLRAEIVPLLREKQAEDFDTWRDRMLERGEYGEHKRLRNRSLRRQRRERDRPAPPPPKFKHENIGGGEVTLDHVMLRTFDPRTNQAVVEPVTLRFEGWQNSSGVITLEAVLPYNADQAKPPLTKLAEQLASRQGHISYPESHRGNVRAKTIVATYVLPGGEPEPYSKREHVPVKDHREAIRMFGTTLKSLR
jgi:hypothetical protein